MAGVCAIAASSDGADGRTRIATVSVETRPVANKCRLLREALDGEGAELRVSIADLPRFLELI